MYDAPRPGGPEGQLSPVEQLNVAINDERGVLTQEATMLARISSGSSVGLLTNAGTEAFLPHYRAMLQGMNNIYAYQESYVNRSDFDALFAASMYLHWHNGNYFPNDQIAEMRERAARGEYSEHYQIAEAHRLGRRTPLDLGIQAVSKELKYSSIGSGADLTRNKAIVLALHARMLDQMQETYGEVDFSSAFITEALLNAPFIGTLLSGKPLSEAQTAQHEAYLHDVLRFASELAVDDRIQTFGDITHNYPVSWTDEFKANSLDSFDAEYVAKAYDLAKRLAAGDVQLDEIYTLLRESTMRRGHLFTARVVDMFTNPRLLVMQREEKDRQFDHIIGSEKPKRVFDRLIALLAERDPILKDLGLVILAGKPGHGKSMTVDAFLNRLPENSRGLVLHSGGKNIETEVDLLRRLATQHPDLEFMVVIEDIDAVAGDRLSSSGANVFLDLDSVNKDSKAPTNLHIIATTNRPDIIDKAVMRPGRSPLIVHYDSPSVDDRKGIARLYADQYGRVCDSDIIDYIAASSEGFSQDEVRSLLWSLRFKGVAQPTPGDIDEEVALVKLRNNAKNYTE